MSTSARRIIAVLQIAGSLLAAVYLLSSDPPWTSATVPIARRVLQGLAYLFFALAFYAGVRLWRGERSGARLSLILQAVQVPIVAIGTLRYELFVGFQMGVLLEWPIVRMIVAPGGGFDVSLNHSYGEVRPFSIGVNLIALVSAFYLARYQRAGMESLKYNVRPDVGR